jgi:putative colanic acid biosynthesis glycosyltransferase
MRIILIDVNYKYSSTGKIVFDLKNQIILSGNQAFVAYGRGPKTIDKNVFKFGIWIETLLDAFLTRITGLVGYFSIFSTFRLISYINKIKPDIIHLHEIHSYFLNLPIFYNFIKSKGIKVIHTLHNEFIYTGKCWNTIGCNKFVSGCYSCPKIKEYPKSWIFDFTNFMQKNKISLINGIKNITFVSPSIWLKNNFSNSLLKNKDCVVIRNGIEIHEIKPSTKNNFFLNNGIPVNFSKYILFVSSDPFSDNKGGKYIFEMAKLNKDYFYLIIGDSSNTISKESNVLIFPKTNDHLILHSFYYYFDASLILSKHENLPTVVIESFCAGTPVFGFHSKGSKELVSTQLGSLVYYGDLTALMHKLLDFFNKNSDKIWSKHEIMEYGKKLFSKKRMFSDYLNLYNK